MSELTLPLYCIVGRRPVMAVETAEGGMDIRAFNWQTGEFDRDMSYLTAIMFGDDDTDHLEEAEFFERVEALRKDL